jgi:GNAT superfamily N-acetyltransferase
MLHSATAVPVSAILPWRERFRQEAQGQIVHDSLHGREGWTQSYLLAAHGTPAGYGAIALGGPWKGTRTIFEFHLAREHRGQAFALFETFLQASAATHFEFQSSHTLLMAMAQLWAEKLTSERIVFRDEITTVLPVPVGAVFRRATTADAARVFAHHREPVGDWVVEIDGVIAATGGILTHYNPPHGDLHMEVAAPFRRRGLGGYLVQELKRVCREGGGVPCARCSPDNLASRQTLQKAGFVPYAHILIGPVLRPPA